MGWKTEITKTYILAETAHVIFQVIPLLVRMFFFCQKIRAYNALDFQVFDSSLRRKVRMQRSAGRLFHKFKKHYTPVNTVNSNKVTRAADTNYTLLWSVT